MVIRYADDFIIIAKTRELLEQNVLPAVRAFLAARGLTLSEEKTRITRIDGGFDFLGQHTKKHTNGKLITTPTRKSVQGLQEAVRRIMMAHRAEDTAVMIRRLNQTILGWANYHRHICSFRIFYWFDGWLYHEIKRWLHGRHPNKGRRWIMKTYYRVYQDNRWSFHATRRHRDGRKEVRDLMKASGVKITRHIKVRAAANPYDSAWMEYFANRKANKQYFGQE